ncbi:MAG: pyridoxal phosphate-dependent aminotransferase [Campylobacterales bacterium]|nr:pyridoxal phosphate-dependent aminotransferase [Campylobacterales bacterium]
MFSDRINRLGESLTMAITQKAREVKASGREVYGFSVGEPDFDTPVKIKEAAKKALDDGFTKYTPVVGIPDLLSTIKDKLKKENGLDYETNQIVVSNGAKQSLFNLLAVLLNHGDEVIIPNPAWVSYPDMVNFFGGKPVFVETTEEEKFKLTAEKLKAAITDKTKILMLNSPSNPTGSVYTEEEYAALGKVLEGTDIIVFSDEMYEKLIYGGKKFVSIAGVSEDLYKRTITINGVSKGMAMTGWRMGYFATADASIAKAVGKLQGQSTSNINSITQVACITALDGSVDKEIEEMRIAFEKRRDLTVKLINDIDGLSVIEPDGAFYLFVNCSEVEKDSMKFCLDLLDKKAVATVPGVGFGSDGFFRMSFAMDEDTLRRGIGLIEEFVQGK